MAYNYTWQQMVQFAQDKIGTERSNTNVKFPPDIVADAIVKQANLWLPRLPDDMLDTTVHVADALTGRTWTAAVPAVVLPADCGRFIGLSIDGCTIELYGTTRDKTFNHYAYRKSTFRRTNIGHYLVCLQGRRLLIHPTPATALTYRLSYIKRINDYAGDLTAECQVPKEAVEFILTAVQADAKFADMRTSEGIACLRQFMELLQAVFGIEDREDTGERAGS